MPTFYDWMLNRYFDKDNWRGDLARDMFRDRRIGGRINEMNTKKDLWDYLEDKSSNNHDIMEKVLPGCWKAYTKFCKELAAY